MNVWKDGKIVETFEPCILVRLPDRFDVAWLCSDGMLRRGRYPTDVVWRKTPIPETRNTVEGKDDHV